MKDFSGKVVIVTGSAGNLGVAVAQLFAEAGANLVLIDRDQQRLEVLYLHLVGSAQHLIAGGVNLMDGVETRKAIDSAIARFGRIDVLVNTVGGYRAGDPVHEISDETWDFMIQLNARTVFNTCRAAIPTMLEQGYGKIVNVAARSGLVGGKEMGAYSASKSMVIRLTESLSAEVKDAGINVNCVMPGTIDTPQNREAMPGAKFDRWVKPEAIAEVIYFLAKDESRAITGAAIPVYGRS